MHIDWLSNHNNLPCSTCWGCFSKGVRFTLYRSLAQFRPVIQIRCSRLGQLWVTHWNTLETCSHCVWVPADSIMGGSMDGWVEKPETVALSFFLLWTGAMALVKQVWAWLKWHMGRDYTLPICLIFNLSFIFLTRHTPFWFYRPTFTVLDEHLLMLSLFLPALQLFCSDWISYPCSRGLHSACSSVTLLFFAGIGK